MKAYELKLIGVNPIVFDKTGKEITRREGFNKHSQMDILFPVLSNTGFFVKNAQILDSRIVDIEPININLPIPEKIIKNPKITKRTFISDWHSPMSINVKTGEVIENQKYRDASKAKQVFIEAHELGHFFYDTEKYCDLVASLSLLQNGYGKSQCLEVLRTMLTSSPEKTERYNFVLSHLKQL